jgi:hypothetical protein
MALSTYSDLKTSVANYLARSDLTSQIPDFIQFAEIRLRRELRIRQMLLSTTLTTTGGTSTVNLPSDFLELKNIYIDGDPTWTLTYLTPSTLERNGRTYEQNKPNYYTILSSTIKFGATPDTTYSVPLLYYAAPAFLSDSNTSNVFLANCPDLLLYGSLAEAEPYLMNDARLATWQAMYDRGLLGLRESDDRGEFSASPLTMSVTAR